MYNTSLHVFTPVVYCFIWDGSIFFYEFFSRFIINFRQFITQAMNFNASEPYNAFYIICFFSYFIRSRPQANVFFLLNPSSIKKNCIFFAYYDNIDWISVYLIYRRVI